MEQVYSVFSFGRGSWSWSRTAVEQIKGGGIKDDDKVSQVQKERL